MKRIHPIFVLLIVATLAYGLLIPQLGFYWDDLPISWISYELGAAALTRYFSTNRPMWGWLYQITNTFIPQVPVYWQVFALFWRWACTVVVWAIARRLRPERPALALCISLFFLLYPGFNQHWVSYLYSHVYIVLFCLLLSIYLMLLGGRLRSIIALLLSANNLWMHEYFFLLELARPAVIWLALGEESLNTQQKLVKTFRQWLPYLTVFTLAVLYRLFIFNNQVYGFGIQDQLKGDPITTIRFLFQDVLTSLWAAWPAGWAQAVRFPDPALDGPRISALYGLVILLTGLLAWVVISSRSESIDQNHNHHRYGWGLLALGFAAFLLAGPAWWLTGNPVSLDFPASRTMLSFLPGASLFAAGILEFIPRRIRPTLTAILLALAAGFQFLMANDFRRDWSVQKNLFWQLTWRAPGLAPNTILLLNDRALQFRTMHGATTLVDERVLDYYADNSLGAALNWIYAPDNHSDRVDYVLFFPKSRLGGSLPSLTKGESVRYDYLAGKFEGSTSQVVAFFYAPPGCLRLLDPDLDIQNRLLPDETLMREAAGLSSTKPILPEAIARMPDVYGPEPVHGWCYFFERADLARQLEDWPTVVQLGQTAFSLDDHPNDPIERFVFIEGYAQTGDWEKAEELSNDSYLVSKEYLRPLLCRLWQRIDGNTSVSDEKNRIVQQVKTNFSCNW